MRFINPKKELNTEKGIRFSHYLIQEEIGRGGVGAVYRALDETTGRVVALKKYLLCTLQGGFPQRIRFDGSTEKKTLSEPLRGALKPGRAVRPTPAQIEDLSKRLAPLFEAGLPTVQPDKGLTTQAAKITGTGLGMGKGLFAVVVLAVAAPVIV